MNTIQKVTTSYNEQEDRLHLAYQDEEGRAQGLWLTQRLTSRLVQVLLAQLDDSIATLPDSSAREAVQAWEMSAARAQMEQINPVEGAALSEPALVTSVDINRAGPAYTLIFRWRENQSAALILSGSTALRQWLGILHQHYRMAQWSCNGLWPSWFDIADPTQMTRPPEMLLN